LFLGQLPQELRERLLQVLVLDLPGDRRGGLAGVAAPCEVEGHEEAPDAAERLALSGRRAAGPRLERPQGKFARGVLTEKPGDVDLDQPPGRKQGPVEKR